MKRHTIVEEDLDRILTADLPWTRVASSTVLITGANGFVPAYLVEALLYWNEKNWNSRMRVVALVRNEQKARRRFEIYAGRTDLDFLVQDVSLPLPIDYKVDYILHAASHASPKYFDKDPTGTLKPNVIGTYQLLEFACRSPVRSFLFVSSGEVYGRFSAKPDHPIGEDDFGSLNPLDVRSCYGESKRMGEAMCKAWHSQFGIPTKVARLGHTYGPGMDLNDGRVFADFVANIVRGEDIVLKSDGSASRPFCYLSDAVIGLLMILLRGDSGEAYNLMNDEGEIRILDLAQMLCRFFPNKELKVVFPMKSHSPAQNFSNPHEGVSVDTSRVRHLGWNPSVNIENGFRRTILSFT